MAKILIVSAFAPYPRLGGDRKRLAGIVRALSAVHDVTLVSPVTTAVAPTVECLPANLLTWIPAGGEGPEPTVGVRLRTLVDARLRAQSFDLIIVFGHTLAATLRLEESPPVLVEQCLIPTIFARRAASACGMRVRARYGFRASERNHRAAVRRLLKRHPFVVCSEVDRGHLLKLGPGSVYVVENFTERDLVRKRRDNLVFGAGPVVIVGPFSAMANRDALRWFARRVMPFLRRRLGNREVVAAGTGADPRLVRSAQAAGIRMLGWVDDLEGMLARAGVLAMPLRIGSGTKTRIFDAGALQIPVVTTSVGAEGIPIEDNRHAIIADTARDFATAIVEVTRNSELARKLATRLRDLVEERFLEETALATYSAVVESVCARADRG